MVTAASLLLMLTAVTSAAPKSTPVTGFDVTRYLGTWYEIARLPTPFEKDLINVTATYEALENGKVRVINRGEKNGKESVAKGTARFATKDRTIAALEVTFFWPFYGPYTVIDLDSAYHYAMVTSGSTYLWILCRSPQLDEAIVKDLVAKAKGLGFATEQLIMVPQKARSDQRARSDQD